MGGAKSGAKGGAKKLLQLNFFLALSF